MPPYWAVNATILDICYDLKLPPTKEYLPRSGNPGCGFSSSQTPLHHPSVFASTRPTDLLSYLSVLVLYVILIVSTIAVIGAAIAFHYRIKRLMSSSPEPHHGEGLISEEPHARGDRSAHS